MVKHSNFRLVSKNDQIWYQKSSSGLSSSLTRWKLVFLFWDCKSWWKWHFHENFLHIDEISCQAGPALQNPDAICKNSYYQSIEWLQISKVYISWIFTFLVCFLCNKKVVRFGQLLQNMFEIIFKAKSDSFLWYTKTNKISNIYENLK